MLAAVRTAVTLLQMAVVVGAPVWLALRVARRSGPAWGLCTAGAVAFVGSQLVHLPLNWALGKLGILGAEALPPLWRLPAAALLLGTTAGLCEETARYLVMRHWKREARSGAQALMLGVGHGGIESIIVGGLAGLALVNLTFIERVGVENLGLDPRIEALVRHQLAQPLSLEALAALERLMVLVFHLSASMLVAVAVVRRRPALLLAAVGWHTLLDTGCVWVLHTLGPVAAEGWIAAFVPASLLIVRWGMRSLPRHEELHPPRARPAASGEPIELVAVTRRFGAAVVALRGASFTIRRGERACLLGPNGAGKTTTIRLLTGALAPTEGYAFLFGAASDEPAYLGAKRRVGIVPQQPGMYGDVTVRRYLELVRALYGAGDLDEVGRSLGLEPYYDRPMSALSGGMQRRLSLAAALVSHPDLLILDEPTAGLDPIASREVSETLARVTRGRTTLLCTHNLAEAEELCETAVILRDGEVLVHASIEALRNQAVPKLALRAVQGPERLVVALRERGHEADQSDGAAVLALADAERRAPELLRALLADGVDVYACQIERPTLEDLFLRVVQAGLAPPSSRAARELGARRPTEAP
jgi:ABC-2 type transport system ATP-binding protein